MAFHLIKKNCIYHYRLRIPRELFGPLGRKELRKSLGTSHRPTAERRAVIATALAYQLFATIRSMPSPTPQDIQEAMRAFYDGLLAADLGERVRASRDPEQSPAWEQYVRENRRAKEAEQLRDDLRIGRIVTVEPKVRDVIAREGWEISPDSEEYYNLCFSMLRALVEATNRRVERDQAVFYGTPEDPIVIAPAVPTASSPSPARSAVAVPPAPSLRPEPAEEQRLTPAVPAVAKPAAARIMAAASASASPPTAEPPAQEAPKTACTGKAALKPIEILDEFWAEKERRPETRRDYEVSLRVLAEVTGDKAIGEITVEDIVAFKAELLKTPANYVQRFSTHSIKEAQAANQRRPAIERYDTISARTVKDKYLANVKALFAWAARNRILKFNVAQPITIDGVSTDEQRRCFEPEELRTIWNAPLFTGCASQGAPLSPGRYLVRDHRYWAPLIARWTGLRGGEIGRLFVSDIVERHGVMCIQVKPGDARRNRCGFVDSIKTENAKRTIPILPVLVRLGFLDYVEECRRKKHKWLFPYWRPNPAKGYSGTFPKWFCNTFLVHVGVKERLTAFHSYRHSFEQMLEDSGINDDIQIKLMGHTGEQLGARKKYLKSELTAEQMQKFLSLDVGAEVEHLIRLRATESAT